MSKKEQRKIPDNSCDIGVTDDALVVVQFAVPTKEMTFSPQQAKQLGLGFIEMGTKAESLQRVQPPGKTVAGTSRVKH